MNKYRKQLEEEILRHKETEDKILRDKGLQNLYIFNKYIMGAQEGESKVPLAPFHKDLCNFVQDSRDKKKLILVPRMHLKSTLVTVGYCLFRILNDPNIRILILSGTYQNAVDFVGAIEDHLQRNEKIKELFGDIAKNPVQWKADRFTLSTDRTSIGEKEPTVLGAGIESNIVSKHFDLVILDDIVVRENTETAEQIDKVIKRYKDVIDLMDTKAELIIIGTRWVDNDAYSWVLDPANHQVESFLTYIKRAMEWDGDIVHALKTGEGFNSSLWPEKFTREVLLDRYYSKGPYEFSTQYLNDPVPDSEATFRKDWFHSYEEEDVKGYQLNNYMTVDPAFSTEKEADYTAIVISGIDQFGNIYFRDGVRAKMTPQQTIWEIFRLAEQYKPSKIGIEDVTFGKTLGYSIKEEMRIRGRYLPIVPVKPQARSKEDRIRGLQPLYANGTVFHNSVCPLTKYLEDELRRFPRGAHDDLVDAFSYTLDFFNKPRKENRRRESKYLY